ncbi:hypothetical protein AX774_g1819 [Zancudomyces culisetae]|uniref:Uncharacterized protein n=1 Tax=Zancudomyces culisetae TaxID=1213189 RepID=A0A1R1PUR4_ZANCU|nr:hypothetical protein AX774_g1819 [Zancudomyces culisetae]|eukprot:OMH84659.1 hypothetical protein AX774_g1819 [Zancudomyces culisetae]
MDLPSYSITISPIVYGKLGIFVPITMFEMEDKKYVPIPDIFCVSALFYAFSFLLFFMTLYVFVFLQNPTRILYIPTIYYCSDSILLNYLYYYYYYYYFAQTITGNNITTANKK